MGSGARDELASFFEKAPTFAIGDIVYIGLKFLDICKKLLIVFKKLLIVGDHGLDIVAEKFIV